MFETFDVKGLDIADQPVLALIGNLKLFEWFNNIKSVTGVVVHSGDELTYVTLVKHG